MSDERTDLILNMLRAIRTEQSAQRERLDEIIVRLEREVAGLHGNYVSLSVRLDNLDRRVGGIEQRLELVEIPISS